MDRHMGRTTVRDIMGQPQSALMAIMTTTPTHAPLTATMGLAGSQAASSLAQVPGSAADIMGVAVTMAGAASQAADAVSQDLEGSLVAAR